MASRTELFPATTPLNSVHQHPTFAWLKINAHHSVALARISRMIFRWRLWLAYIYDRVQQVFRANLTAYYLQRTTQREATFDPCMLNGYWGTNCSLYPTLGVKHVFYLEYAIKCRWLGYFGLAEQIFTELLPSSHSIPLLSIERGLFYLYAGYYKDAALLLKDMPPSSHPPSPSQTAVWRLLRILKAAAEMWAFGNLESALIEAKAVRMWLLTVPLEEYSDVMINCICQFHMIIGVCLTDSNWLDGSDETNLPLSTTRTRADSLATLRRSLQGQGRIFEAQLLVKHEADLRPSPSNLQPFEEYLYFAAERLAQAGDPGFFKLILTKIYYALQLANTGQADKAGSELANTERLLKNILAFESIQSSPAELISRCQVVEKKALHMRDYMILRLCLLEAVSTSRKLVAELQTPHEISTAKRYRDLCFARYFEFETEKPRSAYFLAPNLVRLTSQYLLEDCRPSHVLEIVRDFEKDFPLYGDPWHGEHLLGNAVRAARAIGDRSSEMSYEEKRLRLVKQCPFMTSLSDGSFQLKEVTDQNYLLEWTNESGETSEKGNSAMKISSGLLLRWVKAALRERHISLCEACELLRIDLSTGIARQQTTVESVINEISRDDLARQLFGSEGPLEPELWDPWFAIVSCHLYNAKLHQSRIQQHHLLLQIQNCRAMWILTSGCRSRAAVALSETEFRRLLRILHSLDPQVPTRENILTCKAGIATCIIQRSTLPGSKETGFITDNMLDEAKSIHTELAAIYATTGQIQLLYRAKKSIALILWQTSLLFHSDSLALCLECVQEMDDIYRDMRMESAILTGSRSFVAKHAFSETFGTGLYSLGINAAYVAWKYFRLTHKDQLSSLNASECGKLFQEDIKNVSNMIGWMQKSKARSLMDLLGLDAQCPENIMQSARQSTTAVGLLLQYDDLCHQLVKASTIQKIQLRERLKELHSDMRRDKALAPMMDIRNGTSITSDGILEIGKWAGKQVLFIDWVRITWLDSFNLVMVVHRGGEFAGVFTLTIKYEEVEEWIKDQLDTDTPLARSGSSRQLRCLDRLVAPLASISKAGEFLVLCPTTALHRIPLHALRVADQLLIERNPVVYCQSLTILRHCLNSRLEHHDYKLSEVAIISPMDEEAGTGEAALQVARALGVTQDNTTRLNKQHIVECMSQASLVHFHGHVEFQEDEPLEHCLVLTSHDVLTANEIFDMRLKRGTHVTTIGCSSGRAKVSDCDDLLGLIAAFHYAGASSVISALWPIYCDDGIRFSVKFYESLIEQLEGTELHSGSDAINLALAMQKAILHVRRDEEGNILPPHRWAGFTLNGSWLFSRPIPA